MNIIEQLQQKINAAKRQGFKEIKLSVDFLDQIILYCINNFDKNANKKSEDIIIVKTGGSFK